MRLSIRRIQRILSRQHQQRITVYQGHFATTQTSTWAIRNFVSDRAQFSPHGSVVSSNNREKKGIWRRSLTTIATLKYLYSPFFSLAAGNLYFLLRSCLLFNYLKTIKTTPHNVIIRFVRRYSLLRFQGTKGSSDSCPVLSNDLLTGIEDRTATGDMNT